MVREQIRAAMATWAASDAAVAATVATWRTGDAESYWVGASPWNDTPNRRTYVYRDGAVVCLSRPKNETLLEA